LRLGDATIIDTLRIEWPSGIVQELRDVAPKQFLTVTKPADLQPQPQLFLRLQAKKLALHYGRIAPGSDRLTQPVFRQHLLDAWDTQMFSVPDGRAANHPFSVTTFSPPMEARFPGARVSLLRMGSPASSFAITASGVSFSKAAFCSVEAGASIRR
jgi:ASPIC and UnbV